MDEVITKETTTLGPQGFSPMSFIEKLKLAYQAFILADQMPFKLVIGAQATPTGITIESIDEEGDQLEFNVKSV